MSDTEGETVGSTEGISIDTDSDYEPELESDLDKKPSSKPAAKPAASILKSSSAEIEKKSTPTSPTIPKTVPSPITSLEQEMSSLKIEGASEASSYSLETKFPFIQYTYVKDGREWCTCDFLVWSEHEEGFHPFMGGPNRLDLNVLVNPIFPNEERLLVVNQDDPNHNIDTNKQTSLEKISGTITNQLAYGEPLIVPANSVNTLIEIEQIANWSVQAFITANTKWTEEMGATMFHFILQVNMLGTMQIKKKKKKGKTKIYASPAYYRGKTPSRKRESSYHSAYGGEEDDDDMS